MAINASIFKTYDIRGIYPTDINEESISAAGRALAHYLSEGTVIIAHDGRHGSKELAEIIKSAYENECEKIHKKCSIREIGLSTTPMFYFTVCDEKAAGGMMITASHNPKEYNGAKMVEKNGVIISGTKIKEIIDTKL